MTIGDVRNKDRYKTGDFAVRENSTFVTAER